MLALATVLVCVTGCGSTGRAPVVNRSKDEAGPAPVFTREGPSRPLVSERRPDVHVVRPGDTLQAIAFRYRVDARDLARWNRIDNPNLIVVGQRLLLSAPRSAARSERTTTPPVASRESSKAPATTAANDTPARTSAPPASGRLVWQWPATGQTVAGSSPLGGESLQILGTRGQPIAAAAAGEVVYSGSGLRGYGKLIIVKHNEAFLSAYAHNETILVSEGARVAAGERIAEMGSSEAERVMLHFEIRKNGKAVDPRLFLPERR